MKIEDFIPTEILKPFIKTFRIIESKEELVNRVLPNTSFALAFRFKGQIGYVSETGEYNLPTTIFSGLRKSVRLIKYSPNTSMLIVLFKEFGASNFFKGPLHELFEESVSFDNFIKQGELSIVEELLSEAQNNPQRIAIIEQFLLNKIIVFNTDNLIATAVEKIHSAKGFIRIRELANMLNISNDAFEKRFRKIVGASPKQFSSIVRMSSLIHQTQEKPNLIDIAFDAGYYDQSHFNKDFKLFTGQTPTDFFKSSSFW